MRNARGHKGKNELHWKKSEQAHIQNFLHKTCQLGSFWKFHVVAVQNNGDEMYKKGVLHVQRCFLLIRPTAFLAVFVAVAA